MNQDIQYKKYFKYNGVIHVHSTFSDGTGSVNEIVKAAKKAELDWIIITDHNNFDIKEGIIDGITVIKGEEISQEGQNHYLALDIKDCIKPYDDINKIINEVKAQGGFGFAAHPDEGINRNNSHPDIKWVNKSVIPDGIEIWNWFSSWADGFCDKNIFTMLYAYLFRNALIKQPYRVTLNWWDKLNNQTEKIIPAIGGVDAHALKFKKYILPIIVFPYTMMFQTVKNEIFLDAPFKQDFQSRKQQILSAVKSGRNIIFNAKVCKYPPEIYVSNSYNTVSAGESIQLDYMTYLHFNCKRKADIRVYKNSAEFTRLNAKKSEIKITEKGKYRIEMYINGYAFAYSNPFIVKEKTI